MCRREIQTNARIWASDGMVDIEDLKSSGVSRVGSSPISPTSMVFSFHKWQIGKTVGGRDRPTLCGGKLIGKLSPTTRKDCWFESNPSHH